MPVSVQVSLLKGAYPDINMVIRQLPAAGNINLIKIELNPRPVS
jgi:hypothetical protein